MLMFVDENSDPMKPSFWRDNPIPGDDVLQSGGIAYYCEDDIEDGIIKELSDGRKFVVNISLEDGRETILRQLA